MLYRDHHRQLTTQQWCEWYCMHSPQKPDFSSWSSPYIDFIPRDIFLRYNFVTIGLHNGNGAQNFPHEKKQVSKLFTSLNTLLSEFFVHNVRSVSDSYDSYCDVYDSAITKFVLHEHSEYQMIGMSLVTRLMRYNATCIVAVNAEASSRSLENCREFSRLGARLSANPLHRLRITINQHRRCR